MKLKQKKYVDRKKDREMQKRIRDGANYSLSVLGKAFVLRGSGRFLNIRETKG